MYPVSDRFLRAIGESTSRKSVVDVYYDSPTPIIRDLPIVSGQIDVSRTSRTRRAGSLVVPGSELFDKIEPYGAEFVIRTGVVYSNGAEELVPQGVFMLDNSSLSVTSNTSFTLFDRAHRVFETSMHNVDDTDEFAGESSINLMNRLIQYADPSWPNPTWEVLVDSSLNNPIIPGGFDKDTDRWRMVELVSELMGAETYFGVDGNAVVAPPPVVDVATSIDDAVWAVNYGEVLIDHSRTKSRENTYNCVMVVGASPANGGKPVYAMVFDLNPNSPTYWHGPFGKKTLRVENAAVTTKTQATIAAAAKLAQSTGLSRTMEFKSLCNPALDAGDIISMISTPGGPIEIHMLESFSIPLGPGNFSAVTRMVQYV